MYLTNLYSIIIVLVILVNASNIYAQQIPEIKTDELAKMQEKQNNLEAEATKAGQPKPHAKFIVVDVRSEAERKISMIPGAISKADYENNKVQYQDCLVIPYCLIGGRCTRYAQELSQQGVKVMNYKGSILDWCRSKQPLVTPEGKSTNKVHTGSANNKVPPEYQPVW